MATTMEISYGDFSMEVPAMYEVCPRCEGAGSHTNPAIDGNGITAEEMDEMGPEFLEDYMSGVYDVACERCGGARVVLVPNLDRCSAEERAAIAEHEREEYAYARERESEIRYGY